jgi:drug/metabolite transporter (DMT)-like permease
MSPVIIVFTIAIGGSVFIVILDGRLLFGGRLNKLTAGGVSFGLAAVILLSLSQSELRERMLRIWHEGLEAVQLVKLTT